MRVDGRKTKGLSTIEQAVPYIMPKRVDAQNCVTEYVEEEPIKQFIRQMREEQGVHLGRMSVVIAAYYKTVLRYPYVNRFVMNRKIYDRNHFCVSFVMLKTREDGRADETTVKLFLEPTDTVFTIHEKIEELIQKNSVPEHNNSTDKFSQFMFSLPLLPYLVVTLFRLLDKWGALPRFIIDLSPFHTSMFITNLASINTTHIYHHCYEFGTTSVFMCMGKAIPNHQTMEKDKKLIPLSIVMDERICTGNDYATFNKAFLRTLRHPETLLEMGQKDENAAFAESK